MKKGITPPPDDTKKAGRRFRFAEKASGGD